MMSHTFSIGDRSGGQSSTFTLSTKPHCCSTCRMRPGIVLITTMAFPWKTSSWWQYMSLYNPLYASVVIVPSHTCQSLMPFALMLSYTRQAFALASVADESLDGPFGLWDGELTIRFVAETSLNVDWSYHSTHFHWFLTIWDELWPREPGSIELMCSFLLELQIFKLHFWMQQQTLVNDSGFLKYSWAHVAIFSVTVSYAIPSEGSKFKHIQLRFPALPYKYCNFSGFPQSFHNVIQVTLWKTEILCSFALRNVIFDLFDTSLWKFGTKWWAMIQLCLQRLRCSVYTQTWYLDLLLIHLFTVNCLETV